MDEYSPKRHDIAQLKFLCESLYDESMATLSDSHHGWINDPTSMMNLQLNELIDHVAFFAMNYKIKHPEDCNLTELIDKYLDDSFTLFSNYGIDTQEFRLWQTSSKHLFNTFHEECTHLSVPVNHSF